MTKPNDIFLTYSGLLCFLIIHVMIGGVEAGSGAHRSGLTAGDVLMKLNGKPVDGISILHGLGQTGRSLVHSALGILVRILFVVFAIPLAGIRGYLYGILFSEILSSSLHIYALMHNSIALPIDKKF